MRLRLPQVFLRHPLKLGGNVKFLSVDTGTPGSKQKFGLGLDAGALIDSGEGLKFGLSVTDMTSALGVRNPSLNTGVSYRLKRGLLLAGDLRVRAPRMAQFRSSRLGGTPTAPLGPRVSTSSRRSPSEAW